MVKIGLLLTFILFGGFVFAGNTGIFNDPKIYYFGKDRITGKTTVVQGCRPERVQLDGSCDRSFNLMEVLQAK